MEKSLSHGRSQKSIHAVEMFVNQNKVIVPSGDSLIYDAEELWADGIDRSLARYLHGLLFLRDWPASILNDETGQLALIARTIILDWHGNFPDYKECQHSMAFHDETTAQRLLTLVTIIEACKKYLNQEQLEPLTRLTLETSNLLLNENFHSSGNNHGMFQDIALRNYSIFADPKDTSIEEKLRISINRLNEYFQSSFTSDGVHRENSPTYHLMITRNLSEHTAFLSILGLDHGNLELTSLLEKAGEYATHAVLPSGVFLPLSDTQQTAISDNRHNVFNSDEFAFATTMGRRGKEPLKKWLSLPDSGYFYARDEWTDKNSTFISFVAAYNGDYHKHSDDLSLFLWTRGIPVLSEAGPFGYNYADPLTKYGFSQYAHNNIIVNQRSTPRTDLNSNSVWMGGVEEDDYGLSVEAGTGRLKNAYHGRKVEISNDFNRIVVFDSIQSIEINKYECLWNLGPEIDVVTHGDGFELFHNGDKVADAFIEATSPVSISVHKGELRPRPLGWHFPAFGKSTPTNTVIVTVEGADASINTTFNLKNFKYEDRGLAKNEEGWLQSVTVPKLNYLLDKAKLVSPNLAVVFSALAPVGNFSYNYRRSMGDSKYNVLYILDDFGDQGSYYWLQHGRDNIYTAVQDLIRKTMRDLGIESASCVSMFGTSKGGTAAILHGAGLGAGAVFVGAPQFKVGSFLSKPHPNILNYMSRGSTPAHVFSLDKRVVEKLDSFKVLPPIHQIVGSEDHHFRGHALPLFDYLRSRGSSAELEVLSGVPHSEIGMIYRMLLPKVAFSALTASFESIRQYDCQINSVDRDLNLVMNSKSDDLYSYKLYCGQKLISTEPYSRRKQISWTSLPAGFYRVRVYTRTAAGGVLPFTTQWNEVR